MPPRPASKALTRFTVLDLTRVRAGPTCVRQLADWGANVIKIETPEHVEAADMGGPRAGPDFSNLHRNKRSITLNLKSPEGVAALKRLVKRADVLVETTGPTSNAGSGSITRPSPRSTLSWFTRAFRGSGRPGPTPRVPASTRSPRGWAA